MCFSPQRRTIFRHQNFQKCSRNERQFFYIFTSKCAFRHSGRTILQHQNFTKVVQDTSCFVTFSLPNVLFATAAYIFSTAERSKKCFGHLTCFVHFHFKMCFSPQRRAIFDLSADHLTSAPAALTGLLFD